ncbi:MAG: hypothetical protein EA351_14995 [Gemmatimonadales bacterium]|nr:MAG: hypothetical protein EA351_14995 [Gemmatimonadales bacterium]
MRTNTRPAPALLLGVFAFLFLLAGCSDDPAPPFTISGEGDIDGFLYLDNERTGLFDPSDGDQPLAGVSLEVRERGTPRAFSGGQVTSGSDGRFAVSGLPPGTHDLWVDTGTLPEGALVCRNPLPVSIYRFEAAAVLLGAEPVCLITIQAAKDSGPGTFVNVQGVVVTAGEMRSDYTYVQDGSTGIRVFSGTFAGQVQRGDLVSVTGEIAIFNNDFQLSSPSLVEIVEQGVPLPIPQETTTGAIATVGPSNADPMQGRLVVVRGAELVTGFVAGGNRNANINDGSGTTELRVETGISGAGDAILTTLGVQVGSCYDIVGVIGNFRGTGQIFPRTPADVTPAECASE